MIGRDFRQTRLPAATIALIYIAIGAAWLIGFDRLIEMLVRDAELVARLRLLNGWIFILASALLLYALIYHEISDKVEKQRYSRALFEETPIGLALCRMTGELVDVNQAYADILGRSIEEALQLSYWDITPESYAGLEQEQLRRLDFTGHYGPYEKEYIHKDGHLVPVRLQGIIMHTNGEPMIWSSIEDMSAKKRMEATFDNLFTMNRDGYVITSGAGEVFTANPAFANLVGYSIDELQQLTWRELTPGVPQSWEKEIYSEQLLEHGFTDLREQEYTHKDGRHFPAEVQAYLLNRADSLEDALIGTFVRDITRRKLLEQERESQQAQVTRYNEVLASFIMDSNFMAGAFEPFLPTFVQKLSDAIGVSRVSVWVLHRTGERSYIKCLDLWDAKSQTHSTGEELDASDYPSYFETLLTDRTLLFNDVTSDPRTRELNKDYFPANSITSMLDAPFHLGGEIAGVLCLEHIDTPRVWRAEEQTFVISSADILSIVFASSKRRELEETLSRSEKLDALGKLTGGIAHDFNNVLGIIIGYAEILELALGKETDLGKYAREMITAGQRGAKLTKNLLSFSARKSSNVETVNINELLNDEQHMLEKTMTVRIALNFDLEDSLWPVNINYNDMEHAILNMCINAMHAIDGSGELTFTTANTHIEKQDARALNISEGDYVSLGIRDTGAGMADDVIDKIFEPFFSTKGKQGSGLGLSQVYGFVQRSAGSIVVRSEPGNGTLFTLYFPRSTEHETPTPDDAPDSRSKHHGTETVLVVDDEPALTRLSKKVLSSHGYTVRTASSAKGALEALKQHPKVDVLLSDIVMPGMDGYELASIVCDEYPAIKIQLMSGYARENNSAVLDEHLHENILRKPFDSEKLLTRMRALLDSPQ